MFGTERKARYQEKYACEPSIQSAIVSSRITADSLFRRDCFENVNKINK